MKKFVLFFLFVFLYQVKLLDCRDVVIQNCESTTKEEDQDICIKCKDRHFLFFHNLYCIACNDPYYGQIGCEGNCNGSRYQQDRIAYCNPNECKEGYYYLNGICFNCTIGSPGCKTCNVTETKINNQIDYSYQCQECLSNEYKLDEFGICQKCEMLIIQNKNVINVMMDIIYLLIKLVKDVRNILLKMVIVQSALIMILIMKKVHAIVKVILSLIQIKLALIVEMVATIVF